jgi:hypothetical protein|eukprot:CAMPEP_0169119518 /NCGR_PEP_ID=MMETSP1015-20121227/31604_1 /TAXON_ID=342587 /ORGANISM="Karlodinium micrum, Strain CCMP2283" /LENGTH=340 /DNA_ID=CAMNT_0009182413 /DNA_START=72 /DNA_END=1094 /DNA_ORIENTATION=-
MTLVTGGMGGLGSIASFLCAAEGMGPVMTTSRTGALPGGQAQLHMLEGILAYTPHISLKVDMGQSNAVADLFAWLGKMGKPGHAVQTHMVNIDEITQSLTSQMSFTGKRKSSSIKSTLELMTWVRDRYAKALVDLKKKFDAGDLGGKSKKEVEDTMLSFRENEKRVGELISEIRKKLSIPEGVMVSEAALRKVRQNAAQLSEAVADVERMSCLSAATERVVDGKSDQVPQAEPKGMQVQDLMNLVARIQSQKNENAESRQWLVVGGGNSNGIFVQSGSEALSEEFAERLATGARIEEVALSETGKLLYRKIQGEGPECGWVALAQDGVPLLMKAEETELE